MADTLLRPLISLRSMRLVTYGCGERFDSSKFKPVKDCDYVKPSGGLSHTLMVAPRAA
jgi:hypothetical protein